MQSASSGSGDLRYFPSMYTSFPHFTVPDMSISKGQTGGSLHLPGSSMTNSSCERRSLRKHRRRTDDEDCTAKRPKMMDEGESDPLEDTSSRSDPRWLTGCATVSPTIQHSAPAISSSSNNTVQIQYSQSASPASTRAETEGSCMEVEAAQRKLQEIEDRAETEGSCMEVEEAQRKLQEIEDRITLEDDSDEDLDVEPVQRRPVLVLSESLREGLQHGIADILPHTVAQSVSRSCMELVLWRPLEDPLTQQLKDSLQRQQCKQQPASKQTPTQTPVNIKVPPDEHLFSPVSVSGSTEEDMEL